MWVTNHFMWCFSSVHKHTDVCSTASILHGLLAIALSDPYRVHLVGPSDLKVYISTNHNYSESSLQSDPKILIFRLDARDNAPGSLVRNALQSMCILMKLMHAFFNWIHPGKNHEQHVHCNHMSSWHVGCNKGNSVSRVLHSGFPAAWQSYCNEVRKVTASHPYTCVSVYQFKFTPCV